MIFLTFWIVRPKFYAVVPVTMLRLYNVYIMIYETFFSNSFS